MTAGISIDVISDVVCPWCFIGQKRLDQAVAMTPETQVEIRWRPFQLDPTLPPEGKDRLAYMLAKFGNQARIDEIHARIEPLGAAEGIEFDFAAIRVSPNTLDAHRLIRWAGRDGGELQGRVARDLFSRYFEAGKDIGDRSVLVDVAHQAGMDAGVVAARLAGDDDRDKVAAEIEQASRMGISGVPCFLFEGKYAVSGAQDAATLAGAIRQVAGMKTQGELPA